MESENRGSFWEKWLWEAASYREVRFFNGQLLLFKRGFWFTVGGSSRLGVAVPKSYAELLRKCLG